MTSFVDKVINYKASGLGCEHHFGRQNSNYKRKYQKKKKKVPKDNSFMKAWMPFSNYFLGFRLARSCLKSVHWDLGRRISWQSTCKS